MYFLENQDELINKFKFAIKIFKNNKIIFEFGELKLEDNEIVHMLKNKKTQNILNINENKYLFSYEEKNGYEMITGIQIDNYLNELSNKIEIMDNEIAKITDSIYDEIFITDKKGKVIYANKACERLYDMSKEDFIGMNVVDLEKSLIFSPSVTSKVINSGKKESIMQETITGRKIIATAIPIYDENSKLKKVVTNSRDLTELHNIKKELEVKNKYIRFVDKKIKILDYDKNDGSKMIYSSEKMDIIYNLINKVSDSDIEILLTGESGVGKTMIAKYIHNKSKRKTQKFEVVNCGAIPENLLESELFGYEQGSFTGAREDGKKGLFEISEGGTIFLDEIGELPMNLQSKLLRVIQEKKYRKIGSNIEKKADFRLITATNQNLSEKIENKEFRKDFYYRINGIKIDIPPLRQRKEDIKILCESFLDVYNQKYSMKKELSSEVMDIFYLSKWEGNIREIKHIIERLVLVSESNIIVKEDLPEYFILNEELNEEEPFILIDENIKLEEATELLERELVIKAYNKNKSTYKVAKKLGISQPTAYRKIKKHISDS